MSARSLWLGGVIVLGLGLAGLAYLGYRTPPTERQSPEPRTPVSQPPATEQARPVEPTPEPVGVGDPQAQPLASGSAAASAPGVPQPSEEREPTPIADTAPPALADPPELRTERERQQHGSAPDRRRSAAAESPGVSAPGTATGSAAASEPGPGAPLTVYSEPPGSTATTRPPREQPAAAAREHRPPTADDRSEGGATSGSAAAAASEPSSSRFDRPREQTPPPQVLMLPSASVISVGSSLAVSVVISSASDVGHVPFHVQFDSRVLQFAHGQEGGFLGSDGTQTAFFAAPTSQGDAVVVGLSRLGRVDGVDGAGELCVLHFTAVGPGNTTLSFARAKVRDSTNRIVPSVFTPTAIAVQ